MIWFHWTKFSKFTTLIIILKYLLLLLLIILQLLLLLFWLHGGDIGTLQLFRNAIKTIFSLTITNKFVNDLKIVGYFRSWAQTVETLLYICHLIIIFWTSAPRHIQSLTDRIAFDWSFFSPRNFSSCTKHAFFPVII